MTHIEKAHKDKTLQRAQQEVDRKLTGYTNGETDPQNQLVIAAKIHGQILTIRGQIDRLENQAQRLEEQANKLTDQFRLVAEKAINQIAPQVWYKDEPHHYDNATYVLGLPPEILANNPTLELTTDEMGAPILLINGNPYQGTLNLDRNPFSAALRQHQLNQEKKDQ